MVQEAKLEAAVASCKDRDVLRASLNVPVWHIEGGGAQVGSCSQNQKACWGNGGCTKVCISRSIVKRV